MAKAKTELGLTLKMASGGGFNFFRPLVSIEVDPEGDVEAQVEASLDAMQTMWRATEGKMVEIVESSELAESESVLIELRTRMAALEERLDSQQGTNALPAKEMTWTAPAKKSSSKKKS